MQLTETFESSLNVTAASDLRVERGIKRFDTTRRAFVFGDATVDWLLSFSHGDWSTIYVAQSTSVSELETKIFRRLGVTLSSPESWMVDSRKCDVLLGAGSAERSADVLSQLASKVPVLIISTGGAPPLRKLLQTWPVWHHRVGGTTTGCARMWVRGWSFPGLPETVSRSLGHILDHSELPTTCSRQPTFTHLLPSDLLPLDEVSVGLSPVVFPTHATRTKWGTRQLTPKEIGLCFDAPQWVISNPVLLSMMHVRYKTAVGFPLKILQAPLQACLQAIDPPLGLVSAPPGSVAVSPTEDPRGSWLPSLGKWLPASWVDAAAVTAKAAKADDADIHTALWDTRISSVLACGSTVQGVIRRFFFGIWCRRVGLSFHSFLTRTYGADWSSQLRRARQRAASSRQRQGGSGTLALESSKQGFEGKASISDLALVLDANAGQVALHQVLSSDWWDWSNGSSLLFWRWDARTQLPAARDGMEIFVQGTLPTKTRSARAPHPDKRAMLGPKIDKVRARNYISKGPVVNLTDFFDVPKGDSDIRIVYNGTTSGLNEALFAPGFFLPNSDSAARLLMYYSYTVDADLGEMFLNFPMDPLIRPYAGVELTALRPYLEDVPRSGRILERWERLFMGMKPSPYNAVRYFYWGEEFARGNPFAEGNALRYDRVILNLPGMSDFDPSKPNVMKWNDSVDRLAGDILTFVDDLRASGYDRENAWQVARQITSRLQYLGIQDAARKRRPSSQSGGAWAGTIFQILLEEIFKTVSQEKWDKGRAIIFELASLCCDRSDPPNLCHKDLERKRGFLIHLAMTFTSIIPFLKGLHLTIDSWRPMRDDDGWKFSHKEARVWLEHKLGNGLTEEAVYDLLNSGAPGTVQPVERFFDDLDFLTKFFSSTSPPKVMVRAIRLLFVVYGFGDASGTGFGSTFTVANGISYRIGVWRPDESEESSNWKEFTNVVESLEEEAKTGRLDNSQVYFCTDNSTVEAALHKGSSKSRKLLALVIRVKLLETQRGIRIFVSHVSGLRMIAEGGDGVSRGSLNEGVMAGDTMLSFIPWHLSATERSPSLLSWLVSWVGSKLEPLAPIDWFQKGHDIRGWKKQPGEPFQRPILKAGVFGWFPAPAAADVAIEQLRIARIKRQDSSHVFVCPRLLCPVWLKQLNKACDLIFKIPAGAPGWPADMFEPLLIDQSPGSSRAPQSFLGWQESCMRCGKTLTWTEGLFCANFGTSLIGFAPCRSAWCPGCYVSSAEILFHVATTEAQNGKPTEDDQDRMTSIWGKKGRSARESFLSARAGDHMMVPFECDRCVFHKLRRTPPNVASEQDRLLLACIRRANLDTFWSRSADTVAKHRGQVKMGIALSRLVGLPTPYPDPGPLPPFDHCGYGVAIQMLLKSRQPGTYHSTHQEWETIRKMRTAYTNQVRASGSANESALSMSDGDGKNYQRLSDDPCASMWFMRFLRGCKRRMGQDWRPDRAITSQVMQHLLARVENRILNLGGDLHKTDRERWIFAGSYFAFSYVLSLRGQEGLLLELKGCRKYFSSQFGDDGDPSKHVVIALLGKVKGEHHERQHLLPSVNVTKSGIQVRRWMRRTLAANYANDRMTGPAFCDEKGVVLPTRVMNEMLHEILGEIRMEHPSLFLADITGQADIEDKYNVFRSFRRGSDSRAIAMQVCPNDIDVINRWTKKEAAGTSRPTHKMQHHYADVNILLPNFIRYTKVM